MKVTGQPHTAETLPLGKEHPVSIEWEAGWAYSWSGKNLLSLTWYFRFSNP
jgi:hypothetical protein